MIRLPSLVPDKSISHRAALIAALAEGDSRVENFSGADDCLRTVGAMQALGCDMQVADRVLHVRRPAGAALVEPPSPLDMGNSGTGCRLLLGVLAGHAIRATLTGDESLRSRPMDRVTIPLTQMGAAFEGNGGRVRAPVTVTGRRPLQAIRWKLEPASAQVKSAILLASLHAEGETVIEEPLATRDHTERMLAAAGVHIACEGGIIRMKGGAKLRPLHMRVPEDFSAAAFFLALGILAPRLGGVEIAHVGLNPTRTAFLDVLRLMGADVRVRYDADEGGEKLGEVSVRPGPLHGVEIPLEWVPNLIDEIPILSILASAASGRTVVRGAKELRVKESDRIKSIVEMVRHFSGQIEEREDGFEIVGAGSAAAFCDGIGAASRILPVFGDHRIAMSILISAEASRAPVTVDDTACIGTSFPNFFQCLEDSRGTGHRD